MTETKRPVGRPKGSTKEHKTTYKFFTLTCKPEEYDKIKELSAKANKTMARFIIDTILKD